MLDVDPRYVPLRVPPRFTHANTCPVTCVSVRGPTWIRIVTRLGRPGPVLRPRALVPVQKRRVILRVQPHELVPRNLTQQVIVAVEVTRRDRPGGAYPRVHALHPARDVAHRRVVEVAEQLGYLLEELVLRQVRYPARFPFIHPR